MENKKWLLGIVALCKVIGEVEVEVKEDGGFVRAVTWRCRVLIEHVLHVSIEYGESGIGSPIDRHNR